jgi:tyrosine-protein phosphatase non-receptor type 23
MWLALLQEFFAEQLNKHAKTVGFIDQNLAAQDNVLRALTDANAKFARIRKENANITNR